MLHTGYLLKCYWIPLYIYQSVTEMPNQLLLIWWGNNNVVKKHWNILGNIKEKIENSNKMMIKDR